MDDEEREVVMTWTMLLACANEVRTLIINMTEDLGQSSTVAAMVLLGFAMDLSECDLPDCQAEHGTVTEEMHGLVDMVLRAAEDEGVVMMRDTE